MPIAEFFLLGNIFPHKKVNIFLLIAFKISYGVGRNVRDWVIFGRASNVLSLISHKVYVYLGFNHRFQHCRGYIMTGCFVARGNQYMQWSGFCNVKCRPSVINYHLSP